MIRVASVFLFLLGACQAPGNDANQATVAPKTSVAPEGEVGKAQRLVRERLGEGEGLVFSDPLRTASDGVPIVCGHYEQGEERRRYIVVDGTDVFVEPAVPTEQMDGYFAQYCETRGRG